MASNSDDRRAYLTTNMRRELNVAKTAFDNAGYESRRTHTNSSIATTSGLRDLALDLQTHSELSPWGRQKWKSKAGIRHGHHIYRPINSAGCEMRLLTLYPPRRGLVHLLECELEVVNLDRKQCPESVSYTHLTLPTIYSV